jgi:hypothetical protein
MTLNEPVWITRIYEITNEHGNTVYELELVGIKTQTIWKTYVDPKMRNFRNWSLPIALAQELAVILDVGLTVLNEEKLIVNADSKPNIAATTTNEEALEIIGEYWRGPNIGGLFE